MLTLSKDTIIAQLESSEEFPIRLSDVWEWVGYARKDTALKGFLRAKLIEGVDWIDLRQTADSEESEIVRKNLELDEISGDIVMTVDGFKMWAMAANTDRGREVRRYFVEVEKEWKAAKLNSMPQIRPEHIEAHQFKVAQYAPWSLSNPVAAKVFTGWLVDEHRQLNQSVQPVFAIPSEAIQGALDGAFLNLNRSGLAMNKLFHLIDRMPTLDRMSREAMKELADSLTEAEEQISDLKKERSRLKSETLDLKAAVKASEMQVATLKRQLSELKAKYKDVPSSPKVSVCRRQVGDNAKHANPKYLPPSQ